MKIVLVIWHFAPLKHVPMILQGTDRVSLSLMMDVGGGMPLIWPHGLKAAGPAKVLPKDAPESIRSLTAR